MKKEPQMARRGIAFQNQAVQSHKTLSYDTCKEVQITVPTVFTTSKIILCQRVHVPPGPLSPNKKN